MKTRYRSHKPLFGKQVLILQIGIDKKLGDWGGESYGFDDPPPNWNPDEIVTTWRDAKVEDLTVLEERLHGIK